MMGRVFVFMETLKILEIVTHFVTFCHAEHQSKIPFKISSPLRGEGKGEGKR